MTSFRIDADEVAGRLGLDEAPPIVWTERYTYSTPTYFHLESRTIVISQNADWEALRRILNTNGRAGQQLPSVLDTLRFAVAHEMVHALQLDQRGLLGIQAWAMPQLADEARGVPHHKLPIEAEADTMARDLWKHVKINGHKARGAR